MLAPELARTVHSVYCKAESLRVEHPEVLPASREEERIALARDVAARERDDRLQRMHEREQARHQAMLDTIRESLTPLAFNVKWVPKASKAKGAETACLVISDVHVGKKTERYNIAAAESCLRQIFERTFLISDLHRQAYPVDELNIFATGDIVDGDSIYPTQAHHVDGTMIDQIFGSLPTWAACLAETARRFARVRVHCVRGNHGRVNKFAHESSNWDLIFYHAWRSACANIPNVEWNIPNGWHQVVKVGGLSVLQFHGHQIKMTMNLPWYGLTTRILRWAAAESIEDFSIAVHGHFHSSSYVRWASKRIFSNGTLVDGDEFAKEFIGMESSRTQWLFGVKDKRVTWQYELGMA
jgi:predicted phosphodiesterase